MLTLFVWRYIAVSDFSRVTIIIYECLIDDVDLKNAMIEANSVAIDWKPLYSVEQCACLTPFTYSTKKVPKFINNKFDNTLEEEEKLKHEPMMRYSKTK